MKRNANGMGTIYLRKDGRYEAATYATLPDGRRKRVYGYGPTREAAQRKLSDKLDRVQSKRRLQETEQRKLSI